LTTATTSSPQPTGWTLADVVDLEHYLAQPAAPDEAGSLRRHLPAPWQMAAGPVDPAARRRLLHAWVEWQRGLQADGGGSPGQRLQRSLQELSAAAWLLGLLAGGSLAGLWLSAGTGTPVNAPLFWVAAVGLQILLLLLALLGVAWRGRARWSGGWAWLIAVAGRLGSGLHGTQRAALQATLGRLARRQDSLHGLLAWPAVALAQRFAVAFNIGLLLAMLALHLPLVDVRFGWQSTYPISAAQMQQAVHAVAAPWRWAWPQAQPTLDELRATRYAPGQPAHTLPAQAARAWWPFLAASVAGYGLLLRAAWLLLAGLAQRRRLARLPLDHPEALALWRRLAGAPVQAAAGLAQLPAPGPLPAATAPAAGPCTALVAQELAWPDEAVRTAMQARFGPLLGLHRLPVDDRSAAAALAPELAAGPQRPAWVLVVVPAARDPIVAVAQCLRAVLQAAGPGREVLVLLVPEAPPSGPDAAIDPRRVAIWQRFAQIQRLGLTVEAWAA
jgi:hypothetical protein